MDARSSVAACSGVQHIRCPPQPMAGDKCSLMDVVDKQCQGHRLQVIICLLVSNREKTRQQNLLTWPLCYLIFAWWEFVWSLFAEGAGSLQALLKKRGWGRTVMAGCGDNGHETNSVTFNFTVTISLTSHGLEHVWNHDIPPLCIVVASYVVVARCDWFPCVFAFNPGRSLTCQIQNHVWLTSK